MPVHFIYTLGPVQDFIATARRCRDLWFGSWLLSELSKAVARAICEQPGVGRDALVFPSIADPRALAANSPMSVANKVVAQLADGVAPERIGAACDAALRERLRELRDRTMNRIDVRDRRHVDVALVCSQLDDLVETQWVSVEHTTAGYAEARSRAERTLAATKHTRLWRAVPWHASHAAKSSLDGLRESVLAPAVHGRGEHAAWTRRRLGLDDREHLCGVGMLKRRGCRGGHDGEHLFFSTPHLAAIPVLDRMRALDATQQRHVMRTWSEYLEVLRHHDADLEQTVQARWTHPILERHDGQLLFASRVIERLEHLEDRRRRSALDQALPALRRVLAAAGVTEPSPYIAVLVADGDHSTPGWPG